MLVYDMHIYICILDVLSWIRGHRSGPFHPSQKASVAVLRYSRLSGTDVQGLQPSTRIQDTSSTQADAVLGHWTAFYLCVLNY